MATVATTWTPTAPLVCSVGAPGDSGDAPLCCLEKQGADEPLEVELRAPPSSAVTEVQVVAACRTVELYALAAAGDKQYIATARGTEVEPLDGLRAYGFRLDVPKPAPRVALKLLSLSDKAKARVPVTHLAVKVTGATLKAAPVPAAPTGNNLPALMAMLGVDRPPDAAGLGAMLEAFGGTGAAATRPAAAQVPPPRPPPQHPSAGLADLEARLMGRMEALEARLMTALNTLEVRLSVVEARHGATPTLESLD